MQTPGIVVLKLLIILPHNELLQFKPSFSYRAPRLWNDLFCQFDLLLQLVHFGNDLKVLCFV